MATTTLDRSVHPSRGPYYEKVATVIMFLSGRLDETLSLSKIAKAAASSRFHFNRRFRQVTGIPPCQYLYAMRLAKAKALLLTTKLKVIDICYEVGYNSLGTFTSRFTELVGMAPSRFRIEARRPGEQSAFSTAAVRRLELSEEDPALDGEVHAPADFKGLVFVGLFSDAIPQGRPTICTILEGSGTFHLTNLPQGNFYLFALAIPQPVDARNLFHSPSALRAGGQRITVANGQIKGAANLVLRPPEPVDPPILVALHPLLAQRRESSRRPISYGLPIH